MARSQFGKGRRGCTRRQDAGRKPVKKPMPKGLATLPE